MAVLHAGARLAQLQHPGVLLVQVRGPEQLQQGAAVPHRETPE